MSRLKELAVLDRFQDNAMAHHEGFWICGEDATVVARHLLRLMGRDRQKAEESRRRKIKKAMKGLTRG